MVAQGNSETPQGGVGSKCPERFDSATQSYASVAQWIRVVRFERIGREFESLRGRQINTL